MRFNSAVLTAENLDPGAIDDQPDGLEASATPEEGVPDSGDEQLPDTVEQAATDEEQSEMMDNQLSEGEATLDENAQEGIDLENAAETLDKLQEQAAQIVVENGAISPTAAKIIQSTTEALLKRVGVDPTPLPTMEAFRGKWTKSDASRLTVEALDKAGTNISGRVISSLKAAFNFVLKFITNIFKNRALLENRLKGLLKRVKELPSSAGFKKPTISGLTVDAFRFRGYSTRYSIDLQLKTAEKAMDDYGLVTDAIQAIRDDRDPGDVMIKLMNSAANTVTSTIDIDGNPEEVYGAFPGGRSLLYTGTGMDTRARFVNNSPDFKPKPLDALSTSEVQRYLAQAIGVIQALRSVESRANRLGDAVKGIIRKIETGYAQLRGAMGSESHATFYQMRKSGYAAQSLLNELVARLPAQAFQVCLNTAKLAEMSISNIK